MADETVARLVPTKCEADIAADLKRRIDEAFGPVLALMDEAATHGFFVRWDGIVPKPPFLKHGLVNLRLERHF